MRVTFLGVRGSTPAPGAGFVRYGGHTSCVAVTRGTDVTPSLVLDAGTGLRSLTEIVGRNPWRGEILLSHLHWDHVQGLPFFAAGDRDDAEVRVHLPAQDGRSGLDLLSLCMSPPAFPITPRGLRGRWTFQAHEPGPIDVTGYAVRAAEIEHKGGRTFAYRIEADGVAIAYAPDHAPATRVAPGVEELFAGVDVLIHDAQFLDDERRIAEDYGHATVEDAIALARRVGAARCVLFHHGPGRTDDAMDAIAATFAHDPGIVVAYEGLVLEVVPAAVV